MVSDTETTTVGSIPNEIARWAEDFEEYGDYPRVVVREMGRNGYQTEFLYPNAVLMIESDLVTGVPDLDKHGIVTGEVENIQLTESSRGVNLDFEGFEPF